MGVSSCYVPGCTSGYDSTRRRCKIAGRRDYSLFTAPGDPLLFKLWDIAIRRADRKFTQRDKVCELHFREEEIDKFYITKLPDGTIDKIERGRRTLKHGAIPSIFPNRPVYDVKSLLDKCKTLKTHSVNTEIAIFLEKSVDEDLIRNAGFENSDANLNQKTNSMSIINVTNEENADVDAIKSVIPCQDLIEDEPVINDCFTYKILCENLTMIKKPNDWWCISSTVKYVICARWNDDHIAEKKIVIDFCLTVKVYLRNREIVIPSQIEIDSIEDISALLAKVEKYGICAGIDKWKDCLVCLFDQHLGLGRSKKWCQQCRISARKETYATSRLQNKKVLSTEMSDVMKRRKLYQKIVHERRKNIRLINKVEKFRRRLEFYAKMCPSVKSEVIRMSSLPSFQDSVKSSKDVDVSDLVSD